MTPSYDVRLIMGDINAKVEINITDFEKIVGKMG